MSHVSISRSYAILLGLEAYVKARKKVKRGVENLHRGRQRIAHPAAYKQKKAEVARGKSAEKEGQVLATRSEEIGLHQRDLSLPTRAKLRFPPRPRSQGGSANGDAESQCSTEIAGENDRRHVE